MKMQRLYAKILTSNFKEFIKTKCTKRQHQPQLNVPNFQLQLEGNEDLIPAEKVADCIFCIITMFDNPKDLITCLKKEKSNKWHFDWGSPSMISLNDIIGHHLGIPIHITG